MAYEITVDRSRSLLDFQVNGASRSGFPTKCWWDSNKKIPAGTYTGCSTRRMSSKTDSVTGELRPAVWLPKVKGYSAIFIHEGKNESYSKGCIVCARKLVIDIFNLVPHYGRNIEVVVSG